MLTSSVVNAAKAVSRLNPLQTQRSSSALSIVIQNRRSGTVSYDERKAAVKEKRREAWEKKQDRLVSLRTRRDTKPRNVAITKFKDWFGPLRVTNEIRDRKARQAGLPWKVKVVSVVERLPVVMPDIPKWERDFMELQQYLDSFGREYPKELDFFGEPEPYENPGATDEEMMEALLPEGLKIPPRETDADHAGNVRTRDRELKTRVYLAVQEKGAWKFPTGVAKDDETLLDAAVRATAEAIDSDLNLWCPSNCPMAVDTIRYSEGDQNEESKNGFYGEKIFFFRVQWDSGDVEENCMRVDDYAWLTQEEMVEKVKDEQGEDASKFYHYLL